MLLHLQPELMVRSTVPVAEQALTLYLPAAVVALPIRQQPLGLGPPPVFRKSDVALSLLQFSREI